MFCFHTPISFNQRMNMSKSVNSSNPCVKLKQINHQPHKPTRKTPICEQSRSAIIDLIILIAVIGACTFLIYPYVKLLLSQLLEIFRATNFVVTEELLRAPMIYGCLGLSILSALMAVFAITVYTSKKCGKPGCRGLHKAAEFDIQLETEDCVKNSSDNHNSNNNSGKYGLKKGLFELPRDYHRELEAELKKMAPINGRAILVFRARCGCSVGRMEVPGQKKQRKIKK